MQSFKINREELLKFAERIYNEGCFGYLDLCEATADKMVTDFLDGRELVTPSILTTNAPFPLPPSTTPQNFAYVGMDPAGPPPATWAPVMGMSGAPGDEGSVSISISTAGFPSDSYQVDNGVGSSLPMSGAPDTVIGSSDGIIMTETPVIREEVFIRSENYVGNPSERL